VGPVAQSVQRLTTGWAVRIESRWGRDFPPVQTGPRANPASCKMGTGSFPGVKCGRGVLLTTHLLLVPRSWKSRAIPLLILWATPGLKRDCFTFTYIKLQVPRNEGVWEVTRISRTYCMGQRGYHGRTSQVGGESNT